MTELELKQKQFNKAMELHVKKKRYKLLGSIVAVSIILMQIFLLSRALELSIGVTWQIISILLAYLLTDFINGLVHLYMDNNDNYESMAGPLIANFHLHHKTPRYKDHNILAVYFIETGSKVWLVFYLTAVISLFFYTNINPFFLNTLVYIGILSSVAEVSHYLAHNSNSAVAIFLARIRLLLGKRDHAQHHIKDNVNYTFLNGVTDPIVNCIADKYYPGYKNKTDLHYEKFIK